jgi:hypothetical protein
MQADEEADEINKRVYKLENRLAIAILETEEARRARES